MNRYWMFVLFIHGIFFTSCVAQPQEHTDIKEYGLKGKVKVLTTLSYQILTTENGQPAPVDTSQWYRKEVIYFNSKGNVDSLRYITHSHYYKSYQQNPDTTMPFANTTSIIYFYDVKGNKKSGISLSDYSDQPTLITISWPTKNLRVESSIPKGSDRVQRVDSTWIGKNGRDSEGSYHYFMEDRLMPYSRYHAFYTENNDLDYYNEYILLPLAGEVNVITSKIFSKDKEGNWTRSTLTQKGEQELISVLYRSYIYY